MPFIKRSECIVFFFRDGKLHCKNYLTGVEVATAPILVAVLNALGRWCESNKVDRLLSGYSPASVRRTLAKLWRHTLLVHKESAQAKQEALLAPWKVWGEEARFFHFATKHAFRSSPASKELEFSKAKAKNPPQPRRVKHYPRAPQIPLPDQELGFDSEFRRVLLARRTRRHFGAGTIPLERVSEILRLTWGVTGYLRWPGVGRLLLKTSPSGGARHSLEAYLFVLRVAGLQRGVYHYRADRHSLELLSRKASEDRLVELCAGQDWIRHCSALFVMTTVLPRVMWRYRFSRAYRVVLLEAGHFCQTFCLVATWLGLAPFCTAALVDEQVEKDLGLKGASETVLYAAGIGPTLSKNRGPSPIT
ncbi:MAG: SagB/ThcOx family dehydrogenase [Candidatus Acidiferrum sp.]